MYIDQNCKQDKPNHKRNSFFIFSNKLSNTIFFQNFDFTSGESDYTSDEILQHINEYYVQTGTPKSKVDCAELEKNLRKDFEDIAWISCALTGTKLSVEITETLNVCTDTSMKGPCNIIASKNCTIAEIVTASGTPVVKSYFNNPKE